MPSAPADVRTLIEDSGAGVLAWEDVKLETSVGSPVPQGRSIQALV